MACNHKNPPAFDDSTTSYDSWKNELEIWRRVTELPEKKQALAVSLSLTGKARDTALEVSAEDLNQNTGMTTLITKLDDIFLKERKDCAYEAYRHFNNFSKSGDMSMGDYIIQFEQLYNKSTKYEMSLPDAVLAFKLMENAHLSDKDRQLALTSCTKLTFADIKSALRRIFGDQHCGKADQTAEIELKPDSVYVTQDISNKSFSSRSTKRHNSPQ